MVVQVLVGVELDGSVITSAHFSKFSGHWDEHGVTWMTMCTQCVHNLFAFITRWLQL
jgi:hypothetical protein